MPDNGFSLPSLPNMAGPGGAPVAYSPQSIQQAYLQLLKERGKQGQSQPIRSWTQVAGEVLNTAADQMQFSKLMQGANASTSAAANLAIPTGGGGGGADTSAPAAAPQPSLTPQPSGGGDQAAPTGNAPAPSSGFQPASIRNNNPGAMWGNNPSATKFGATGQQDLPGGQHIATFPDAVSGAAAQFDLLDRRYTGKTLRQAIGIWSGNHSADEYTGHVSKVTGISPDTVITKELLRDPKIAVPLGQAMAYHEAGRPYPLTPQQWTQAHGMAFGGQGGAVQPAALTQPASAAPSGSTPAGAGPQVAQAPQQGQAGGLSQPNNGPVSQPNSFSPRPLTPQEVKSLGQLPTRVVKTPQQYNTEYQLFLRMGNQAEADRVKQEFIASQNPMVYELPNKAGNIAYRPENPGAGYMFHPFTHVEKAKDTAGNEREFEYTMNPVSGARTWRDGGPPTAEEAIAGAGKLAGAKTAAEKEAELGASEGKSAHTTLTGIRGLGVTGSNLEPYTSAALKIVNDPSFQQTGLISAENQLWFERLRKSFNLPSTATPLAVLSQIRATALNSMQSGAKSFATEGGEAARLFQTEVDTMKGELPAANATAAEQIAGWNAVHRRAGKWADDAIYFNDWAKNQPKGLPTSDIHSELIKRNRAFSPYEGTSLGAEVPVRQPAPVGAGMNQPTQYQEPPAAPPSPAAPAQPGQPSPTPGPQSAAPLPDEAQQAQSAREAAAATMKKRVTSPQTFPAILAPMLAGPAGGAAASALPGAAARAINSPLGRATESGTLMYYLIKQLLGEGH